MELDLDKLSPQEQKEAAVNICREWFDIDKMAKSFYTDEMLEMKKTLQWRPLEFKRPRRNRVKNRKTATSQAQSCRELYFCSHRRVSIGI